MPRVVAIVGSREYPKDQYWRIDEVLNDLPKDCLVISGGARGVDSYAIKKAEQIGLKTDVDLAQWRTKEGLTDKLAGFKRNTRLVNRCTDVIAFHDGISNGTMDTVKKARQTGKAVRFFNIRGEVVI
jgi:hypothetical protein